MNELNNTCQKVFITGAAGFIGFNLARHYRRQGYTVIGVDNPAYFLTHDISSRRADILQSEGVIMEKGDLSQDCFVDEVFFRHCPHIVFHLAAHTGVRCQNIERFNKDNIDGFINMLSAAQKSPPAHFLFASSSSVYGENAPRPFNENYSPPTPSSLYAKSKLTGEQVAGIFAIGNDFLITVIRFFNVYGPWGRPDMAPFYFTDCLTHEREIKVITGNAKRSWLYIDDAVDACVKLARTSRKANHAPCIVNVAGPELVQTDDLLAEIAQRLNKTPNIVRCPPKFPEITSNPADLNFLKSLIGCVPETTFLDGIEKFLAWYHHEKISLINREEKIHV